MAIINMISNKSETFPEGSRCLLNYGKEDPIVIYETYKGMCIREFERNGYDDSDFYMTVWTGNSTKNIMFATTRGWSYPCMASSVDASEEVIQLARAYEKECERKSAIKNKWEQRKNDVKLSSKLDVTRFQLKELRKALGDDFEVVLSLLKVKNFRSSFRQSIAQQVRDWLVSNKETRREKPLSRKQLECLR